MLVVVSRLPWDRLGRVNTFTRCGPTAFKDLHYVESCEACTDVLTVNWQSQASEHHYLQLLQLAACSYDAYPWLSCRASYVACMGKCCRIQSNY